MRLALLAVACAGLGACSSLSESFRARLVTRPAQVPEAIERVQRELANGEYELALRRARDARDVSGLHPVQRDLLSVSIERSAAGLIESLPSARGSAERLAELVQADLPKQLAVSAGLRAARMRIEFGQPYRAYRLVRTLEEKFPRHHGRSEAGEILADAGLALSNNPWSFLFLDNEDDGVEVLEYLVMTYPSERRCADAFAKLAEIYERRKLYSLAIQRHEELLLSYSASPLAAASEARIPRLRLASLDSPEYDRTELLRARRELEAWLARRKGDPLEDEVRLDYADCLQRLVQSDLGIARYYRRIDRGWGARYHAERALRLALDTGDSRLIASARGLLESIPQTSAEASAPIDDDMFSADSTLLRTTLDKRASTVEPVEPSGSAGEDRR